MKEMKLTDKTRIAIVATIAVMVMPAAAWSVWVVTFANTQWFYSHWQLICLVMGMASVLTLVAIALMLHADQSPTVKTVAACAILATAIVAPAQAGDPVQYETYGAYNFFARAWSWFQNNFTMGDFAQGVSTWNQTTPQATANNAAYGLQQIDHGGSPELPGAQYKMK